MIGARRVFVLLYTASGTAALVYQVTWTRLLALQLGHTVAAASTVLAAFMGGLALGGWLAGRVVSRNVAGAIRNGLLTLLYMYAVLELIVAAVALLLPFALAASVPSLAWAYADGTTPTRLVIVRVAISLALIGVPAVAMGATFPIAAEWYANAGVLYAANTAGAALGAVAAGFWLIPALGLRGTTWVGVALNVAAAAGALWLAHVTTINAEPAEHAQKPPFDSKKKKAPRAQRALRSTSYSSPRLAYAVVAISGFTALVYEVAWTRLLALVIGPTTYAFATMATAFITGLAIGSAIGARLARHVERPAVWLALMLVTGAVAAAASAWFAATRLPLIVAAQVADPGVVFSRVVTSQALTVGVLLLPMTLALGATFPLALAVASGAASRIGDVAARVYSANTVGAIGGALIAGFVLIPQLGLRATFHATAILAAVSGAFCLAAAVREPATENQIGATKSRKNKGGVLLPAAVGILAILVIALLPAWDRELLASGAYKYAPYLGAADLDAILRAGRLEYYKEGAAGTVSVRRLTGTLSLAIDGKVDASNAGDMLTQRLLGLLPVVLHGHAQDICIIGLGSGVTVGAALTPGGVGHLDVVEISPEVVEASHFFDRESGAALSQPGVRLIVGDGRSHLLLTSRRYDVIVSEPSNPWMSGVATLFTREFFEAARARLKPNGLLCQWAHTYDISADDLQSIVRTFASVFPQGTMWLVGDGDLLLIGTNGNAITPRIDGLAAGWRKGTASTALAALGIDDDSAAFDLLSLYAGGPLELARYGGSALVQTDDRTALEYSAPRGIYGRATNGNATAIRALGGPLPEGVRTSVERASDSAWASRGAMQLEVDAYDLAYDAFRRAIALNSRNSTALAGLSDAAAGSHKQDEARAFLTGLAARQPGNSAVRVELSRVRAAMGDFQGALAAVEEALRLEPDDPRAGEQLASILADAGEGERLAAIADALTARFPERPDPRYYRATALFLRGKTEDAVAEVERVTASHPTHARAQNLLGAACATLGRRDCARAAFEASIGANPRDPSAYVNLGVFSLQTSNPREAANHFAEALSIDPESEPARTGLAQARSQLAADGATR